MLTDLISDEAVSESVRYIHKEPPTQVPRDNLPAESGPSTEQTLASAAYFLRLEYKVAIAASAFKPDSGQNALACRKRLGRFSFATRLTKHVHDHDHFGHRVIYETMRSIHRAPVDTTWSPHFFDTIRNRPLLKVLG
jgi:hypothetical protein